MCVCVCSNQYTHSILRRRVLLERSLIFLLVILHFLHLFVLSALFYHSPRVRNSPKLDHELYIVSEWRDLMQHRWFDDAIVFRIQDVHRFFWLQDFIPELASFHTDNPPRPFSCIVFLQEPFGYRVFRKGPFARERLEHHHFFRKNGHVSEGRETSEPRLDSWYPLE